MRTAVGATALAAFLLATASHAQLGPVADAGPDQSVSVGAPVQLDGSGSSDPDSLPLTFSWSLTTVPVGSAAALSSPSAVNPTFVADLAGVYVAQLVVNNGEVNSAPDTVTITASPPVADAGSDQPAVVGVSEQLDGSGSSDPNGLPLTFNWSLTTVPAGSTAALGPANAVNPTFVPDEVGIYVAQLIVNNGFASSAPDTVTITASAPVPPVADAGADQVVAVGATVQMDGSGSSDPNGFPLTFAWALTLRPPGSAAVLSSLNAVAPTFVADVGGAYEVRLIVNNGFASSAPDTASITTSPTSPVPSGIPTLGTWGMLATILLLAFSSVLLLRQR